MELLRLRPSKGNFPFNRVMYSRSIRISRVIVAKTGEYRYVRLRSLFFVLGVRSLKKCDQNPDPLPGERADVSWMKLPQHLGQRLFVCIFPTKDVHKKLGCPSASDSFSEFSQCSILLNIATWAGSCSNEGGLNSETCSQNRPSIRPLPNTSDLHPRGDCECLATAWLALLQCGVFIGKA